MNVMAQAHKNTKALIAQLDYVKLSYRSVFAAQLKIAHKEYKAMQTQTPVVAQFTKAMQDAQKRIAQLEAIDTTDGYIVVVGSIRLPMNEVQGKWCAVENASIFWYREDAQRFAGRIVNGNGEKGQVVKKVDQIAWEISEQRQLIANVQEWIAQAK